MATALPSTVKGKGMEKYIEDVNSANSPEEYESKVSKTGHSTSNWMKVLFNTCEEEFHTEWLTTDEYTALAEESMEDAWRVINLPDWTLEKKGSRKGDIVESKKTEKFGKVYRFTGLVECPPKFMYEEFRDNFTKLPEWNPTILKTETVKKIGPGIDLSYQVTAGGGHGIVAPRDFTSIRRTAALSEDGKVVDDDDNPYNYITSGCSISIPGYPPNKEFVRGVNKVGCWLLTPEIVQTSDGKTDTYTKFQWLMCCDLKGKIPQFVLDVAFATVMLDYIVHVRRFAADCKAKGRF
ncbi:unnamed protein product [Arctia plantaginis]|uniref:START domain-containing protein n=1 Tax=Arctia plantaginis TaxID=874455 RepID=A0A8S0ZT33_ARCPL|nr:unnamed protein product [Arctia plantaginis]